MSRGPMNSTSPIFLYFTLFAKLWTTNMDCVVIVITSQAQPLIRTLMEWTGVHCKVFRTCSYVTSIIVRTRTHSEQTKFFFATRVDRMCLLIKCIAAVNGDCLCFDFCPDNGATTLLSIRNSPKVRQWHSEFELTWVQYELVLRQLNIWFSENIVGTQDRQ